MSDEASKYSTNLASSFREWSMRQVRIQTSSCTGKCDDYIQNEKYLNGWRTKNQHKRREAGLLLIDLRSCVRAFHAALQSDKLSTHPRSSALWCRPLNFISDHRHDSQE